jgi:addiction module RelE/StbE family toxin
MEIKSHPIFIKHYAKRIRPFHHLDSQFKKRFQIFLENPNNPQLKNHKLIGKMTGYRAITISGDIRLVFYKLNHSILLYDIGTHNQVY